MADTQDLLNDPNFMADLRNIELSAQQVADRWPCGKTFVLKWRRRKQIIRSSNGSSRTVDPQGTYSLDPRKDGDILATEEREDGSKSIDVLRTRKVTMEDAREWLRESGDDPDDFHISVRAIVYGHDMYSNKMSAWPKQGANEKELPLWPVIQQAAPVQVLLPSSSHGTVDRDSKYKLSLKCADTQIGYRWFQDGTLDPFHDDKAMDLFVTVCRLYQPDNITILGDFIDLPAQGRFSQEAAFAQTTQLALDRGHQFLAQLRAAAPDAEIILIEGNHDLRMKTFIESNALAAFGLRQADAKPDDWPVMSLPFLLRLDELDIDYVDAYPAATHWDNNLTRNIHGTRANSKGSTMAQYVHELPHVNTWAGHTHRAEVVYRTVLGARGEAIESYAANPGVLCRTDGAVPSVKGATGSDGAPAKIVEDWQQGFGILYYNDTESWPQVYRIKDGTAIIDGRTISV